MTTKRQTCAYFGGLIVYTYHTVFASPKLSLASAKVRHGLIIRPHCGSALLVELQKYLEALDPMFLRIGGVAFMGIDQSLYFSCDCALGQWVESGIAVGIQSY
jgi:hypothetical protein